MAVGKVAYVDSHRRSIFEKKRLNRIAMLNMELYYRASKYAAQCHAQQLYPGLMLPYYLHLAQVATEVLNAYHEQPDFDLNLAHTCALLHDTIEDTRADYDDIKAAFGAQVADGVLALSKNAELPYELRMLDSLDRIELLPREIAIVKMADRCANMQSPPLQWKNERKINYHQEAQVIYHRLQSAHLPLAQRLLRRIGLYENFIDK
jgi:(p)ppGpp synthase/HD superfamily hydrolase